MAYQCVLISVQCTFHLYSRNVRLVTLRCRLFVRNEHKMFVSLAANLHQISHYTTRVRSLHLSQSISPKVFSPTKVSLNTSKPSPVRRSRFWSAWRNPLVPDVNREYPCNLMRDVRKKVEG